MAGVVCVEAEAERACPGQELRSQTGERLGSGPGHLLQEDRKHISLAQDKPGKILLTSTAPVASSPVLSLTCKDCFSIPQTSLLHLRRSAPSSPENTQRRPPPHLAVSPLSPSDCVWNTFCRKSAQGRETAYAVGATKSHLKPSPTY